MSKTSEAEESMRLAKWYERPSRWVDGPEDEFEREELLAALERFIVFAVRGTVVLVTTPLGRCVCERRTVRGAEMVLFDFLKEDESHRRLFWMNASSVKNLGDAFRTAGSKRKEFSMLLSEMRL